MPRADDLHEVWMHRACAQASLGVGLTRPNPPVGAVLVRGGLLIGEGYHHKAGQPHAEIEAIRAAPSNLRGATLYVTLEPCSTWGRTPPCTEAILKSGIKRVVVGARDPNPRHAGRGLTVLRRHGIEVVEGIHRTACESLIRPFSKWILTGLPYVTLKLGVTLDGKIADRTGTSRWITGAAARRRVQELRRSADGILVGVGTALADDPSLLPKPAQGRRPYRIVADAKGRLPLGARLLNDAQRANTLVATTRQSRPAWRQRVDGQGATVLEVAARGSGISLPGMLKQLGARGLLHVVCEGGAELAGSLIRAGLVDEYWIFVAPKLLGGQASLSAVGGPGWKLAEAPALHYTGVELLGEDLLIRARPGTG